MSKGEYTKAARQEKASLREYMLTLLICAVAYGHGHRLGARAVISTGLFPCIKRTKLDMALNGKNKRVEGGRKATDILTDNEQKLLVQWIMDSGRGKHPPRDEDISEQVILMLKARKADNKVRKHGRGTVPLTKAEQRLVTEANAAVSGTWLAGFAADHPQVSRQKERPVLVAL